MIKLFVYGTLKKGFALDGSCPTSRRSVDDGVKTSGTLYDLGPFPGARFNTKNTIIGEVHVFENAKETLVIMDSIEGYNPENKKDSLFIRKVIDVIYKDGKETKAYAYEFNFERYNIKQTIVETGIWEEEIKEKWL